MNNNRTKVITIAALVIAVIALSIGFAAFSSTLNIQTGASVTPNDTFVVKFSNSNSELLETNVTASDGSQYGGSATINNSDVKNPKIDNLSASFTAPGQSVTYTFYVRNMGDFDAYLTDVRFNNAIGKQVFKSCTSSGTNPGTQTIVDDVCRDITFTLELEDTPNKVLTSESNFATEVGNDYKVLKSTTPNTGTTNSKMVKVTIAYPNKDGVHYSDGSFTVNFGSVEMIFATLAGYIPPTPTPATSEEIADSVAGTYNLYMGEGLTQIMLNNDGSATLQAGGNTMPASYEYDNANSIVNINFGQIMPMNYVKVGNNKILYGNPGELLILTTSGSDGLTTLSGTYRDGSSEISFNTSGEYFVAGDVGNYAVIGNIIYVYAQGNSNWYTTDNNFETLYSSGDTENVYTLQS